MMVSIAPFCSPRWLRRAGSRARPSLRTCALAWVCLGVGVAGCAGRATANASAESAAAPVSSSRARAKAALDTLIEALLALASKQSPPQHALDRRRAWVYERAGAAVFDARFLQRQVDAWGDERALADFSAAIESQAAVLAALDATADPVPLVDAIARDVAIKAAQARRLGRPQPVSVHVSTRHDDRREADGYEVWFVRKAFEHTPSAYRRFDRTSSPMTHRFGDAGYYVLWAERRTDSGARLAGERANVEVGLEQTEQNVELIAPTLAP